MYEYMYVTLHGLEHFSHIYEYDVVYIKLILFCLKSLEDISINIFGLLATFTRMDPLDCMLCHLFPKDSLDSALAQLVLSNLVLSTP